MSNSSLIANTGNAKDFLKGYENKVKRFKDAHQRNLGRAATSATQASKARFISKLSGRPNDRPDGPDRKTTSGQFPGYIAWEVNSNAARFKVSQLKSQAWYYMMQEVGTNNSVKVNGISVDRKGNITGSQAVGFPSQKGRFISPRLLWSNRLGGTPTRSKGRAGQDQLYPASMLDKSAVKNWASSRHRIRREIKPKGYIAAGAAVGFRQYSTGMRRDAKRIFK